MRFSKKKYWTWIPLHFKFPGLHNVNLEIFCDWKSLIINLNTVCAHFGEIMQSCCPWKVSKYLQNMHYFSLANRNLLKFCLTQHIKNFVNSWDLKFKINSLTAQKVIKCILYNIFFFRLNWRLSTKEFKLNLNSRYMFLK